MIRIDEATTGGRRGVGTTNHCVHGKDAVIEEIVDWQPYEYWTHRVQVPEPGVPKFTLMYAFEPDGVGTRLIARVLRPRTAKDRAIWAMVEPILASSLEHGVAALAPVLAEEVARRAAENQGAAEPEIARFRRAIPDTGRNRGSPFVVMTRAASRGRPAEGAIDRCVTPS